MPDPIGYQPLKRWTGLRAGRHHYFDHPGQPAQLVNITIEEGISWVTFLDAEAEDQEERFDARDMSGTFEPVR